MIVSFVPIYDTFATILFFHSDSDHMQKRQPDGLPLMNYAVIIKDYSSAGNAGTSIVFLITGESSPSVDSTTTAR